MANQLGIGRGPPKPHLFEEALNSHIEVVFDQSGLNRSSRDQPGRIFPCPHPGCHVTCKRKYERDRHYQTKHVQSKDLFCHIGHCQCSRDADELVETLSDAHFRSWENVGENWARLRRRMKAEVVENRSSATHRCDDYSRVLLHGFVRRDRIVKHIKEAHKDIDTTADGFSIERDALLGQPIFAELQTFWQRSAEDWVRASLGRIQRHDGTWTKWFGRQRVGVASAGFHKYSEIDEKSYVTLMREKGYENVLPWEAHAKLLNLKSAVVEGHQNLHSGFPLAQVNTQISSMQLLPTLAVAPEIPSAGISYAVVMASSSSHPHEVTANAPAFLTPGDSGNSLTTDGGVLTPMQFFGGDQPLNTFTTSITAPVRNTTGPAQETNFWSGYSNFNGLAPAYPVSAWDDDAFDLGSMFNDNFNFDALPQWEPELAVEQAVDQQEGEAGDYSGLGKRRFSDI